MAIDYTEKGYGLHERIQAAGHWLMQQDGTWMSSDDEAVQAIIDAYTLADARAPIVQAIKDEASRRILAFLPETKQRNLLARAIELGALLHRLNAARIAAGSLTQEQAAQEVACETELAAHQALWDRVRAIRTASDVLENSLAGLTTFAAVLSFGIAQGWPE